MLTSNHVATLHAGSLVAAPGPPSNDKGNSGVLIFGIVILVLMFVFIGVAVVRKRSK